MIRCCCDLLMALKLIIDILRQKDDEPKWEKQTVKNMHT